MSTAAGRSPCQQLIQDGLGVRIPATHRALRACQERCLEPGGTPEVVATREGKRNEISIRPLGRPRGCQAQQ